MSDRILTEKIKAEVLKEGMDLVGFAPVTRWENAPFLLSPKAILPDSKTVVVAAVHITDTWTELGGEPEPQDHSPGGWIDQNSLLDRVAYRVVRLLNDNGHKAIGIASSNIWRYREFEDVKSLFAPDLSHIHAATAAGLAQIGWSGLAITPEYGSRCRFISIVTTADLVPTPMYDGPDLCDKCMECVRYCPSGAMRKDLQKPHEISIGGKIFKYANKNIWRCAWAEHFSLDLNSLTLKQDNITEQTILNEIKENGIRGHERGVCQKVCVPPHLRTSEPSFGREGKMFKQKRVNRKYFDNMPTMRKMRDDIMAYAVELGVDLIGVSSIDENTEVGKTAMNEVPGVKTVIGFVMNVPKEAKERTNLNTYSRDAYDYALTFKFHHITLKLGRMIEEMGYYAASYTGWINPYKSHLTQDIAAEFAEMAGVGRLEGNNFTTVEYGEDVIFGAIITDAVLDPTPFVEKAEAAVPFKKLEGNTLRRKLEMIAEKNRVSSFGVAAPEDFDTIVESLKENINQSELGEALVDEESTKNGWAMHGPWKSVFIDENVKIKGPKDYVPNAKSVIVIGMHFQDELIENSGLEKTKQIGTYAFHQYQTALELRYSAMELATYLNKMGYRTLVTENMLGIGSKVDTPRGWLPDARCNAIEAMAAGLGEIGKSGSLLTLEHGVHQRHIVIITDAILPTNAPYTGKKLCSDCGNCESKCPMNAFKGSSFELQVGEITIQYPRIGRHRCDWAKRYSLHKDEGPELIGNQTHVVPTHDGNITIAELSKACEQKDPVMKKRTCILEPCLRHCKSIRESD